jgi:hypothetical protein
MQSVRKIQPDENVLDYIGPGTVIINVKNREIDIKFTDEGMQVGPDGNCIGVTPEELATNIIAVEVK